MNLIYIYTIHTLYTYVQLHVWKFESYTNRIFGWYHIKNADTFEFLDRPEVYKSKGAYLLMNRLMSDICAQKWWLPHQTFKIQ